MVAPSSPRPLSKKSRTLGPVADLERHLPADWWRTLFNATYVKTDGDVVENAANTTADVDLLLAATGLKPSARVLDLCCGQGRHSLELASRGFGQAIAVRFVLLLHFSLALATSYGHERRLKRQRLLS